MAHFVLGVRLKSMFSLSNSCQTIIKHIYYIIFDVNAYGTLHSLGKRTMVLCYVEYLLFYERVARIQNDSLDTIILCLTN